MMKTSNNGPVKGSELFPHLTDAQGNKVKQLVAEGYEFDYDASSAANRTVMRKGYDFWVFGNDGTDEPMPKPPYKPETGITKDQDNKVWELSVMGYQGNLAKSVAAAGLVMEKGDDFWFFGLGGEIMHNPDGITIKV